MTGITKTKHGSKRAKAFTLVELLIVLALLALMAGLTIPRLFGVIRRSRLQQAAQQLAGDLGTARLLAIQYGCPYEFCFEFAGSRYAIRPQYAPNPESLTAGFGADESSPTAQPRPSTPIDVSNQVSGGHGNGHNGTPNPTVSSRPQMRRPQAEFLDDQLNAGVRFGPRDLATQEIRTPFDKPFNGIPTNQDPDDEINSSINSLSLATSPSPNWTYSAVFYPDGRAEKQTITLSDNDGRSIELTIRGLTGGVTIGPVNRPATSNVDQWNDETPINGDSTTIAESVHATR